MEADIDGDKLKTPQWVQVASYKLKCYDIKFESTNASLFTSVDSKVFSLDTFFLPQN